jgi:AAA15 family ATPase/GTPase
MLVQFVVKNFACFKEETKLSMIASNYDRTTRWDDNVIEVPKFGLNLLRSAVIYGANASGKSKLLRAMNFMDFLIHTSSKDKQVGESIEVEPFRLSTATEKEPSLFEIIFIFNNEMYRYGFEVTAKEVVSEWLYHRKSTKEAEIFNRNYLDFEVSAGFKKGKILIDNDMIKENTLLISAAAQFKDKLAQSVLSWFSDFNVLSGLQDNRYAGFSMSTLNTKELKLELMQFIKGADLNIDDLKVVKLNLEELPKELPDELRDFIKEKVKDEDATLFSDVSVIHKKYDENNALVGVEKFSLENDESSGTKKYFAFSAPIITALKNGEVTAIDELDAKLHPNLVCKIVALFNSKETNPLNAQLIFNTHDTNLLSSGFFRRDQIWFTEKDRYGAATLYALSDFKKEGGGKARNNEDYQINYIQGRYGAVPYLGDFDKLFKPKKEVAYENEK